MQDCHWIKKPSVRVMLGLLLCIFTIAANAAWANATEASQATVQPAPVQSPLSLQARPRPQGPSSPRTWPRL